jgi:hypothetical protein
MMHLLQPPEKRHCELVIITFIDYLVNRRKRIASMEIRLIAIGALVVVLGLIRHYLPGRLPHIGFHVIRLSGLVAAMIGILLIAAGILL